MQVASILLIADLPNYLTCIHLLACGKSTLILQMPVNPFASVVAFNGDKVAPRTPLPDPGNGA